MRVHLCGVRGSTPTPGPAFQRYGGNTSSVAIAHDGDESPTLILDAGTGIRKIDALHGERPFAGTILLTHLHWDHTHGLPFFSAGDRDDARARLFLPRQGDSAGDAESLLAGAMSPPHFPIRPSQLRGSWKFAFAPPEMVELEGFEVVSREIPHKGGRTLGYRVSDRHSSLAYLPDHCPTVLGPGPDGWGEYHEAACALADGVDVLIHDAHLLPEELPAQASFGHAAADYAVRLGQHCGVGTTVLFHHHPNRDDDALDELARRLGRDSTVEVAVEDAVLTA